MVSCSVASAPPPPNSIDRSANFDVLSPSSAQVSQFVANETFYANQLLPADSVLVKKLAEEIFTRTAITRDVPLVIGKCTYFSKSTARDGLPRFVRKCADKDSDEVVLDLSKISFANPTKVQLGSFAISPDQSKAVFSIEVGGSANRSGILCAPHDAKESQSSECVEIFTLHELQPQFAWANEKILFFSDGLTAWPTQVYKVDISKPQSRELVYNEQRPGYYISLSRSDSGRFIVITSYGPKTTQAKLLDTKNLNSTWQTINFAQALGHILITDNGHDLLISSNNVVRLQSPDGHKTLDLVKIDGAKSIRTIKAFRDFFAVVTTAQDQSALLICKYDGSKCNSPSLNLTPLTLKLGANPDFEADELQFSISNPITPPVRLRMNAKTNDLGVIDKSIVPEFDSRRYKIEQVEVTSKDGSKVALTIVSKKDYALTPKSTLMRVYGAYGESARIDYDPLTLALIDRGFVVAFAHVRGGGEFGQVWHQSGQALQKENTFDDFEACARYLVAAGLTTNSKLAAYGRSAGGLVVAVEANRHPELFGAIIADYPLVDMLAPTQDEQNGPLPTDQTEFGDRSKPEVQDYLAKYSPYQNISAQNYPALLVSASSQDPLIPFMQPVRYVQKLRSLKLDQNPLVFLVGDSNNHRGEQGKDESVLNAARIAAFVVMTTGLPRLEAVPNYPDTQRSDFK